MRKQRRTADDFVRDMKAKQQHSTPGDIERNSEQAGAAEAVARPSGSSPLRRAAAAVAGSRD